MKLFVLIALLSTILCAAICIGCGGKGGTTNTQFAAPLENTQHYDYSQTIARLALAPVPSGIEPGLWRELTTALADALAEKQATDAPLIDAARVNDLSYSLTADQPTTFAWDYRNPGDYDLNGEVNVADLTKIAEYFMVNDESPGWASALVADGDGNGEVNIADVTLIAQNFMAVVSGYMLQSDNDAMSAQWADVGQVGYSEAIVSEGGGMPRFELGLASAVFGRYYRVVPFEKTTSGEVVRTNTGAAGVPVLFTPDARGDWHTLGRDAQHTSLSTHEGPTTNHVYWTHEIGGSGKSSPVYNIAGTIYVGGGDGLYIINPDHTSVAVYPTPDVVETTPAIAMDGTVYFGCNDGVFRALYPGGGLKWSFTTGGAIRSSPTVAEDGTVYFGSDNGNLYALAADGSLKWLHAFGEPILHAPILRSDGRVSVVVDFHELFSSFDMGDHAQFNDTGMDVYGRPLYAFLEFKPEMWGYPVTVPEEPIETLIVPAMGYVLGYPNYPEPINFAYPHRIEWKLPNDWGGTYTTPAMSPDGNIYFVGVEYELSKFNPAGTPLWEAPYFRSNGYLQTPSVDNSGRVYMGAMSSNLLAVNPDNSELWNFTILRSFVSQIAIAESTIYAVNDNGWLYAIGGPLNATLPDVPIHFSARGAGFNFIEVNWPAANGADGYEVFKDSESNLVATLGNETIYRDTGLNDGVQHEYWIRATNNVGHSELSAPTQGNTKLLPPQNVVASQGLYADKITVSWDAVPNATSYGIYRDAWYSNYEPHVIVEGQNWFEDTETTDWDVHEYFITSMTSFTESYRAPAITGFLMRGVGDSGAGSWNQYGANPGHTRQASVSGPSEGSFAWVHQPDVRFSTTYSSAPVFGSGGAIYLPGTEVLRCINSNGSLRWSTSASCRYPVITTTGTIFTSRSQDGFNNLLVVNSDGTENSMVDTIHPISVVEADNGSFIALEGAAVVSFNFDTSINWRYSHESSLKGTPTISPDGSVYFLSYSWLSEPAQGGGGPKKYPTDLNALNPDGTLRWVRHFDDSIGIPVVGSGGILYFRDVEGQQLIALNPDGTAAWEKQYPEMYFYLSLSEEGTVLIARGDGWVDALSSDGILDWSKDFSEFAAVGFSGSPIIDVTGKIFLLGKPDVDSRCIISCDLSGSLNWTLSREVNDTSSAALDDFGRLFFGGRETIGERYTRNLYCIGPPM